MSVNDSARSGSKQVRKQNMDIFSIFFNIKVYSVFSLESPHRGDSNEYTQYTIFNLKRKITLIIPNLQLWDFFQGTQERVRNSRGKRAVEVLLYLLIISFIYLLQDSTP